MFDVFISHSAKDRTVADALKHKLEAWSIRTWKAPDNILPGQVWEEAITEAISKCKVTLLIWSTDSQDSQQVKRELTLAASMNKVIIPFRIQDLKPEGAFAYYLTNTHWLDAFVQDVESAILEAVDRVSKILGSLSEANEAKAQDEEACSSSVLDVEMGHEGKGKPGAVKESEIQSHSFNTNNTGTKYWNACRIESNYSERRSSEKILLTHSSSGERTWLTADVSLAGSASISIDGEIFDAVPLGASEFYAEAELVVNSTANKL